MTNPTLAHVYSALTRPRARQLRRAILSPVLLALSVGGCTVNGSVSKGGSPAISSSSLTGSGATSSGVTAAAAASPGLSTAVKTQIQAVNTPLNSNPNTALTSADLASLQSNGVLSAGDAAALAPLVQGQ